MKDIKEILSGFSPITLEEIGNAALMDRMDTKFVFPALHLPGILHDMGPEYRVLEVNGVRTPRYETIYYDTPEFFHFQQHHTGHLVRYKVRMRRYLESDDAFMEIKFKNNHGRTIKKRIPVECSREEITAKVRAFVESRTHNEGIALEPKLQVCFSRITLIDQSETERITMDFGLEYSNDKNKHSFEPLIIAEVKQGCRSHSHFVRLMRDRQIRRFTISKYCLGVISLYSHLKHNRFKPKLRQLNKLTYASNGNH